MGGKLENLVSGWLKSKKVARFGWKLINCMRNLIRVELCTLKEMVALKRAVCVVFMLVKYKCKWGLNGIILCLGIVSTGKFNHSSEWWSCIGMDSVRKDKNKRYTGKMCSEIIVGGQWLKCGNEQKEKSCRFSMGDVEWSKCIMPQWSKGNFVKK